MSKHSDEFELYSIGILNWIRNVSVKLRIICQSYQLNELWVNKNIICFDAEYENKMLSCEIYCLETYSIAENLLWK